MNVVLNFLVTLELLTRVPVIEKGIQTGFLLNLLKVNQLLINMI